MEIARQYIIIVLKIILVLINIVLKYLSKYKIIR